MATSRGRSAGTSLAKSTSRVSRKASGLRWTPNGREAKACFFRQALPIIAEPVDIPVSGRGEVEFPVWRRLLEGQKEFETGPFPQPVAAGRGGQRGGKQHVRQPALKAVADGEGVGAPGEVAGNLDPGPWAFRGKGLQDKVPFFHLRSRMKARMAASWASILSVSLNCTRARARLCSGRLALK